MSGASFGHVKDCAASESKFMVVMPRLIASSMGNSVSPGTLPRRSANIARGTMQAILESLFPALAVLTHTNDDVEAVVTRIQALPMALQSHSQ